MLRVVKPKTKRAKRELEKRAPKLEENSKKLLLLHGTKSTTHIKQALSDFYHLRKDSGETSLEFLSQKTDCSLFAFGSHSKKRPDNLVLGRMFDHHVYDMMEVGIENFKSIESLGGRKKASPQAGSKPCFAFVGEKFESDPKFRHFRELIVDFMRGEVVETINLQGLDRVFLCVAVRDKVVFKHCAISFKKSGTKVPRVELIEFGPCMDMVLRRNREPSADLWKDSMRLAPKTTKKKIKNVSTDSLAGKVGRMYVPAQEVGDMALTKMKGLKRERRATAVDKAASKQDKSDSGVSDVTMGETENESSASPNKKLKKQWLESCLGNDNELQNLFR
uniref:Ribosome production factor 2 homolog n=1 Tax=Physcomitrium patens TaxID=3218 RepID=A0A2K1IC30_PHYPA|nr:hypothetical protein PHYPA_030313 [Physcomitrium patens]